MITVSRYLIANILSGICAVFTVYASWVPDKKVSYLVQVAQCLTYAVASVFFGMYATVATMILCAVRNGLNAYERFSLKLCIPFCIAIAVLSVAFNNSGLLGLIPCIATIIYSLGCCLFSSLLSTKINIFVDLFLWTVYDVLIKDIPSTLVDAAGAAVALIAFFRIRRALREQ